MPYGHQIWSQKLFTKCHKLAGVPEGLRPHSGHMGQPEGKKISVDLKYGQTNHWPAWRTLSGSKVNGVVMSQPEVNSEIIKQKGGRLTGIQNGGSPLIDPCTKCDGFDFWRGRGGSNSPAPWCMCTGQNGNDPRDQSIAGRYNCYYILLDHSQVSVNTLVFLSFNHGIWTISHERTTLIRRRIDVMVGCPSKKIVANMKYLWISWELLVANMVITYPAWTIIIPKLSIRSENVDIEMQVRDRHADEH